jgi:hypothetical protein
MAPYEPELVSVLLLQQAMIAIVTNGNQASRMQRFSRPAAPRPGSGVE